MEVKNVERVNLHPDSDDEKFNLVVDKWFKFRDDNLGKVNGIDIVNQAFFIRRVGKVEGYDEVCVVPSSHNPIPWEAFCHLCEQCDMPVSHGEVPLWQNTELHDGLKSMGLVKGAEIKKQPEPEVKQEVNRVAINQVEAPKTTMFDNFEISVKAKVEIEFPDVDVLAMMYQKTKDKDKFLNDLSYFIQSKITKEVAAKVIQ